MRRPATVLSVALALGLLVRQVILWFSSNLALGIVDEQQYAQIARNLVSAWTCPILLSPKGDLQQWEEYGRVLAQ